MTDLRPEHLSGITFDSVVVRELRFVDNLDDTGPARLKDVEINLEVISRVSEDRKRCSVLLRARIKPPEESAAFQVIAAAIEANFSVAGEVSTVTLTDFANKQAPAILMPFLRNEIAHLTSRSRFGQLLLPPINVLALVDQIAKDRDDLDMPVDRPK